MEVDNYHIRYVFNYCTILMTGDEIDADKKGHFENEIVPNVNTPKQLDLYKKFHKYKDHYPESVSGLLKDGYNAFKINVAKRILTQHPSNPIFNYCPKCGKLARTPDAKQCRFCLHDWH